MTKETGEIRGDASRQKRTEGSQDVGRRYRLKHLALPTVLRDMYFSKDDPGPGDRVPDFDLPTLGGGRFRSRGQREVMLMREMRVKDSPRLNAPIREVISHGNRT